MKALVVLEGKESSSQNTRGGKEHTSSYAAKPLRSLQLLLKRSGAVLSEALLTVAK